MLKEKINIDIRFFCLVYESINNKRGPIMNTVEKNTNKEENNYLTYEMVRMLNKTRDFEPIWYIFKKKRNYKYDDLMNLSGDLLNQFSKDVLKFSSDYYTYIVLEYGRLVDGNEKYVIIDAVMNVISSYIISSENKDNSMDSKGKLKHLKNRLSSLKSIKSKDVIIKQMVHHLKDSDLLADMFINETKFYDFLLENEEFMKQADNHNTIIDELFPQLKDNQR